MPAAPEHPEEDKRIAALSGLKIIDTPPETDFDDIVKLCAEICEVPIGLITTVGKERQWFKAKVGIEANETPRETAICGYCILQNDIFEIEDTLMDPRVSDMATVAGEPHIRFYAGYPIQSRDGYPIGSLCVVDTKPKRLSDYQREAMRVLARQVSKQLELRQMNAMLREANRESEHHRESLKQVMRLISHDLRSPMSGLVSLVDLIVEDYRSMEPPEVEDFLSRIQVSGHQVFTLLENLLEWASSEAAMISYKPEAVYLSLLVDHIMETVAPLAKSKSLELATDLPKDLLVRLDRRMIASVLRNLLTNSFKFSKSGGRVEISAHTEGSRIRVEVRDRGVGMEPDQIEQLMQKGIARSTYGTAGEKGTGIGINLVHNFLDQHGSRLEIESAPDEGTRTYFYLEADTSASRTNEA